MSRAASLLGGECRERGLTNVCLCAIRDKAGPGRGGGCVHSSLPDTGTRPRSTAGQAVQRGKARRGSDTEHNIMYLVGRGGTGRGGAGLSGARMGGLGVGYTRNADKMLRCKKGVPRGATNSFAIEPLSTLVNIYAKR